VKKDKQEKITVKKIILNGNFIVSFLVAIAIVFSPDAGAIGLPLSLFLIPAFIMCIANIILFFGYLIKFKIIVVIRSALITAILILSIVFNNLLTSKGLKDLKKYAVKLQNSCEVNKECKNLDPPWIKDWGQIKIYPATFELSMTHFETYWFFKGGYGKDLTMEVAPDYGERKKYIYKNDDWVEIK
jgi:hypothetical protein